MQQTNEKSSKMLSGISKVFDFEDNCEGENEISIMALKAQLDTKLFLENECIETLAANKQLRAKIDDLEQKHSAERKKFQMVLNAGKEDIKILQDKLTKLSKENNHLKHKIIPTWQNRHASVEKERLLLKHQLDSETNGTNASGNARMQIKVWKERYQNEKIKRMKLSMKLQKQDTSSHDTNYKRKRSKQIEDCKINTLLQRSDGSSNPTPSTELKRRRKKSLNLSWKY